jgi:hypothetical protein
LPSVYSNPQRSAALGGEQRQLKSELEQLFARWEEQQAELNNNDEG